MTEIMTMLKKTNIVLGAKRAVEIAIEQDEKTASDWLKEQIQGIG